MHTPTITANPLKCQKDIFSIPEDVTYMNCAYQGPMIHEVEEAGIDELTKRRFPMDIIKEDFFAPAENVKALFSKLIAANDNDRIAILPSASYGLACAAANIDMSQRKRIVVAAEQFPSNYYCWKRLADENEGQLIAVAPSDESRRGASWNEEILASIDANTAVVAIGNVHWADGTKFDLRAIGEKARSVGAKLVIDGTQSVGALPFNVQEIKPDALICAGYKWLLGPYGIALAYYGESFDSGRPIEENWINRQDSDQFEKLVSYTDEYRPKAGRYNAGEHSNFIYMAMIEAALTQILKWNPHRIQKYCDEITRDGIAELQAMGCTVEDAAYRGNHLFGIRLPQGTDVVKVKDALAAKKVYVSVRGIAVRIAPHLYNDKSDMDSLVAALKSVLS